MPINTVGICNRGAIIHSLERLSNSTITSQLGITLCENSNRPTCVQNKRDKKVTVHWLFIYVTYIQMILLHQITHWFQNMLFSFS